MNRCSHALRRSPWINSAFASAIGYLPGSKASVCDERRRFERLARAAADDLAVIRPVTQAADIEDGLKTMTDELGFGASGATARRAIDDYRLVPTRRQIADLGDSPADLVHGNVVRAADPF